MRTLHRAFAAAVAALALFCTVAVSAADAPYRVSATSRIKDLANIEGVRQNQLIGYGLVVGLNGIIARRGRDELHRLAHVARRLRICDVGRDKLQPSLRCPQARQ